MFDRLMFYLSHSLNDLKVNKQRTLFALLCIAAGVAAIVSLQTLAVMMNKTLTGSLQESNRGDIRIEPSGTWSNYIIEPEEDVMMGMGYVFTSAGIEHLQDWFNEHYPGSEVTYRQAITGFGTGMSVMVPERDTYKAFVFNYIVDAANYPLYGSVESEDGDDLGDLITGPTDVVISRNLADDLEAQVGDSFRLAGASEDFTIRGIVPTDAEAGFFNIPAHLLGYYYLDLSATSLFDDVVPGQATTVYVKLGDPSEVDEAARRLGIAGRGMFITTTTDIKEANDQVSDTVDDMVVIMGLVSLLIGGIGIINTMLVIVSRRTTEVAVLKTLGLEPTEVMVLFLVEAILMGIAGSLLGILGGWGLAYAVKGVAETFLAQSLAFTIAPLPALNGFVVGIVITAIFGFLPTLAAGQIRPANVLRPSSNIIPQAGRLSAFVAIVGLILALSLVAQGLLRDLLTDVEVTDGLMLSSITAAIGAVYGLIIAVPLILGGFLSMRRRRRGRSWLAHLLVWLVLLIALPALGGAFGAAVPAIIVLTATMLIVGYLYITLWLLIWAVGGGRVGEIWPGVLVLLFPLFWPLIPVLIGLLIPTWILGWLIQRYTFVDLKIAMRAMLSTKGRGASTLLALVVGVFTLSIITMLVDSITNAFELLLEQASGGNIMILSAGGSQMIDDVRAILDEQGDKVDGYAVVSGYDTSLVDYYDASAGRHLSSSQRSNLSWVFDYSEGRGLDSNLPDVSFREGRNLDPVLDSEPMPDDVWPCVVLSMEFVDSTFGSLGSFMPGVGDQITLDFYGTRDEPITFEIVGVVNETGIVFSDASLYAPLDAFGDRTSDSAYIIADVPEENVRDVRRALVQVPGAFVFETRLINDLLNRVVDQFTSFPILVAALALVTGGIVIANSVALSTLERRREIGVMKAVGLQRERVLGMLLLENGLMGLVGGLIGVGISFIAIVLLLSQIFDDELGDTIPYMTAFSLMALCIVISLTAAILSVWGASGEKPLNVLRYE